MTEEEAKTKWCPFGRPETAATDRCIGSACMAWRWKPQLWEHVSAGSPPSTYVAKEETDGYGRKGKAIPREGFCGLAGRPE